MNISFRPQSVSSIQNLYFGTASQTTGARAGQGTAGVSSLPQTRLSGQNTGAENLIDNLRKSSDIRADLRDRLRQLKNDRQDQQRPFALTSENIVDSLFGDQEDGEDEDLLPKASPNYNFKEISNKIQRAKNPVSAGRAVLAARRKIVELKRRLTTKDGDSDELQIALNHAKRIERVARKKQRHLELEEMVNATKKRDERQDKVEEAADDIRNTVHDAMEEELNDAQDMFDRKQTALFAEAAEEWRQKVQERAAEASDEAIASLDAMVDELTEQERRMLEEAAEMLESMEIVDPHMDEQKLKELKTKHRNQENKEIVKADADYLKESLRHTQERAGQFPGFTVSAAPSVPPVGIDVPVGNAISDAASLAMSGFDMQI